MKYYLGIDGGGTRTVAAVADDNGNILIKKTGKSINFYSVGFPAARKNLAGVIDDIKAQLGDIMFTCAFIGCSALDNEADDELTDKLCKGIINAEKIKMHSDVYIALKALKYAECPCVAVCGTGSMAACEDKNGNIHTAGGWGHIIGDEGSAYAVAVNALKNCCRMYDNGAKTPLVMSATAFFGVDDFRKVTDIIYSSETTKDVIARFAEKVGELASEGDADALEIIITEAENFADTVLILLSKIDCCDVLGLYGGMFIHNKAFANAFSVKIKEKYPDITIKISDIPAEESALALARKM